MPLINCHTYADVSLKKSRFEGKSYDEISCELNIFVNTVKYHIKNALAMLRKSLCRYLICFFLFSLKK